MITISYEALIALIALCGGAGYMPEDSMMAAQHLLCRMPIDIIKFKYVFLNIFYFLL